MSAYWSDICTVLTPLPRSRCKKIVWKCNVSSNVSLMSKFCASLEKKRFAGEILEKNYALVLCNCRKMQFWALFPPSSALCIQENQTWDLRLWVCVNQVANLPCSAHCRRGESANLESQIPSLEKIQFSGKNLIVLFVHYWRRDKILRVDCEIPRPGCLWPRQRFHQT